MNRVRGPIRPQTMQPNEPDIKKAHQDRLADHLNEYPELRAKIVQQLLITLHSRELVTVDAIYTQARKLTGFEPASEPDLSDQNVSTARFWKLEERKHIEAMTLDYAAEFLGREEIDDAVNLVRKREEAYTLEHIAGLAELPFDLLANKVREFCALPSGKTPLSPEETMGTRVALIRHLVSSQLEFIGVAKHHLAIRDFEPLVESTIGPINGIGKVGGKAAGMILAYLVLASDHGRRAGEMVGSGASGPFSCPIKTPATWYLRTDLFEEFLNINGLGGYRNQKYKSVEEIRNEWPLIRQVFKNSSLPAYASEKLRLILEEMKNCPLLVRSSSLLEDNFGHTFSGKYKSIFVGNQGTPDECLDELLGAILEVYASALHPDPLLYRREHHLIDEIEMMGIMVQKVVGRRFGDYYLPAWAGVAFSHNEYRWNKAIRKEDGLLRLVMGLGTRAVDRVGADYPRMIALTSPTMRPEAKAENIRKYSQRFVDAINLKNNRFERISFDVLLGEDFSFPSLDDIVSEYRDGDLRAPATSLVNGPASNLVITFDKLLSRSSFPDEFKKMLRLLEEAYSCPVDVEFAFDGETLYILQCRPQAQRGEIRKVSVPHNIPPEKQIFCSRRFVANADVPDIEYVVYIDPRRYDALPDPQHKTGIGRVVGKLNNRLEKSRFILMGPGRWGSNDINLGVRVTYADINHARVLVEIARSKRGYTPEVSYGTHFFQDLVESSIAYVPLFPDEPGAIFNEAFLSQSENCLTELLADCTEYEEWVRVIHVPSVTQGGRLHLMMDGDSEFGLAFVERVTR